MDEVLSKLRDQYPQCHISTPLVLDDNTASPTLIATWINYSPVILPSVDYVVITKWASRERWPDIVGHMPLTELLGALGDKARPVEVDGNQFYAIAELDSETVANIGRLLKAGLPAAQ